MKKTFCTFLSIIAFVFLSNSHFVFAAGISFTYESVAPTDTSVSVSVQVAGTQTEETDYTIAIYQGTQPVNQLPLVTCYANDLCDTVVQRVFYDLTAGTNYTFVIANADGTEFGATNPNEKTFSTTGGSAGSGTQHQCQTGYYWSDANGACLIGSIDDGTGDPNALPDGNEYSNTYSLGATRVDNSNYNPETGIVDVVITLGGTGIGSKADMQARRFVISLCHQADGTCIDSDVITPTQVEDTLLPDYSVDVSAIVSGSVTPPKSGSYQIRLKDQNGGIITFVSEDKRIVAVTENRADEEESDTSGGNLLRNPLNPEYDSIPKILVAFLDNILLPIAVPFVALAIIWVGFKFVIARGNTEKLKEAKEAAKWTIIGAAVVLGAFVISKAIESTINQIRGTVRAETETIRYDV